MAVSNGSVGVGVNANANASVGVGACASACAGAAGSAAANGAATAAGTGTGTATANGAGAATGGIVQPPWLFPESAGPQPELMVYNSLTRTKVPFRPAEGRLVRWYSCGPTVYDAAHIGHARNYMTFDIIRRVLRDYFGYEITYVMNITDIDDKIIVRARREHLVREYAGAHAETDAEQLRAQLLEAWGAYAQERLAWAGGDFNAWVVWWARERAELDGRVGSWSEGDAKRATALDVAARARAELETGLPGGPRDAWLGTGHFAELLAPWLDGQHGAGVTEQRIYRELAARWEADFLEDMGALNVLPADYLTRVSEYVPEIVRFVERIVANGYGYEAQGSVYFDVAAYDGHAGHAYAKLCPWSAGNAALFEEGEGCLGARLGGKRDARDFALWKCSKPGEPFWPSPWGPGRPGWHIECSAMAAAVLPPTLDIHSGGIDLAFPHHDNELAESEAYYGCAQWVNYFLHAGHVHIEGLKMSKSLKNFVSIKDALRTCTARQLRVLFLQHGWGATLTYKEASLQAAAAADATLATFFSTVQALLREQRAQGAVPRQDAATGLPASEHGPEERALLAALDGARSAVHVALCDSFDTPAALAALLGLVGRCNGYIRDMGRRVSAQALAHVMDYVARIYAVFGLGPAAPAAGGAGEDARLLPVLEHVGRFRDAVRAAALGAGAGAGRAELLAACDALRAELAPFGVVFEDRAGASEAGTLVRLVDPAGAAAAAAADADALAEAERRRLELLRVKEERAAAKALRAAVPPALLFRADPQYSEFDAQGVPVRDAAGVELSKNARKKLLREYDAQVELHAQHLRGISQ